MGQMEHFFPYPNIGPRITIVMAILILNTIAGQQYSLPFFVTLYIVEYHSELL